MKKIHIPGIIPGLLLLTALLSGVPAAFSGGRGPGRNRNTGNEKTRLYRGVSYDVA